MFFLCDYFFLLHSIQVVTRNMCASLRDSCSFNVHTCVLFLLLRNNLDTCQSEISLLLFRWGNLQCNKFIQKLSSLMCRSQFTNSLIFHFCNLTARSFFLLLLWIFLLQQFSMADRSHFILNVTSFAGCYQATHICFLCKWCKTISRDLQALHGEAIAYGCRVSWYTNSTSLAQQKKNGKEGR